MSNRMMVIVDETKQQYAGLYLLLYMLEEEPEIPIALDHDDGQVALADVFEWLLARDYVTVNASNHYQITATGQAIVGTFRDRYQRFLTEFDVYCAVDLEAGEFAFAYYDDFADNEDWQEFLHEGRWDDLRIAIGENMGWDPSEVVFMSFVQEGRFGVDDDGYWEYDRLLGSIWGEIQSVCNSATRIDDLGYEADGEAISGKAVIDDVYQQGQQLMQSLKGRKQA